MRTNGPILYRLMALMMAALLAVQAAAAPLVVSAFEPDVADDGRALTPICAGGTVQYILIDLTGERPPEIVSKSEAQSSDPSAPEVVEFDCPLVVAAVIPMLSDVVGRSFEVTALADWLQSASAELRVSHRLRPPLRGPPLHA